MELTKSELQIMDVLWDTGEPLSRSGLLERSEDKSWKDSSVHVHLNSLLAKGFLCEAGLVRCGTTLGRTFLPTVTREEYYASYLLSQKHRPDLVALTQILLQYASPEELLCIRELL